MLLQATLAATLALTTALKRSAKVAAQMDCLPCFYAWYTMQGQHAECLVADVHSIAVQVLVL